MAFISGYDTHHECPICNVVLNQYWTGIPLHILYKHSMDEMVLVNDYPIPCKNNGRTLKECDVVKVSSPNIESNKGYY